MRDEEFIEATDAVVWGSRGEWQSAPPAGHTGVEVDHVALAVKVEQAIRDAHARGVSEERERCLSIADEIAADSSRDFRVRDTADKIAASIRKGDESPVREGEPGPSEPPDGIGYAGIPR